MTAPSPPEITDLIIHSALEDGMPICIRSIRQTDEERMREGIRQLSAQSRYLRFFSAQPMPSDAVIGRLIEADGHRHIGWGAIASDKPDQPAIGAVHAVRDEALSRSADFSVAVVDAYQGLGLARMLVAVLLTNCRLEGISSLEVQILSENRAARQLVESLGGERCSVDLGVTEYVLPTGPALARLGSDAATPELQAVLAALAAYR